MALLTIMSLSSGLLLKFLLLKFCILSLFFSATQMKEWDRVESAQLERFYQQFAKKLLGAKSGYVLRLSRFCLGKFVVLFCSGIWCR